MVFILTKRLPNRLVMLIGLFLASFSMLLIAKSPIFGLEPSSTMMIAGLVGLGASMPLITIPLKPESLDAIESRGDLNYNPE
jgi:Flp pilus assembly protein protease CpaA